MFQIAFILAAGFAWAAPAAANTDEPPIAAYCELVQDYETFIATEDLAEAFWQLCLDVSERVGAAQVAAVENVCHVAYTRHLYAAEHVKLRLGDNHRFLIDGFLYQTTQQLFCNPQWAQEFIGTLVPDGHKQWLPQCLCFESWTELEKN